MRPTEKERLHHIKHAIQRIGTHTAGLEEASFVKNEVVIDAVLFQFSIIGEAVGYINKDLLTRYPYPWHLVRAFRNYIAHEYFGINLKLVWQTVKQDLPVISTLVNQMIKNEF